MDAQRWFMLAVAIIVVAVIVYRGFLRSREKDRRIDAQAPGRAHSTGEETSQREDRRLAGMSTDDREWEQASLQRHRESKTNIQGAEIPAAHEPHR